ncbi:flagellar protein FlgN [Haloimpatiens sp. FM7315]|uniref:flagellar protein FlgN n=1 Tax=Haloimpatiens sp. FM7315 TaxID=3298609 RepID=UPI0035A3AFE5
MQEKLNGLISAEIESLSSLLELLEEQHGYITKEEVFNMEAIIPKIKEISVEVARIEVERRNLTGDRPISEIVIGSSKPELEENYRKIRKLLHSVTLQKDTNELLIKQGLSYTNKMLEIINPSRPTARTYGASGKVRK